MATNDDFQKAIELINKSNNVLITTHTRPDGDAYTGQLQYYVIY
jgi:nanoRNase/pAp phosphatase (c-di-AMP/oligoRNAs hydrolase)